VAPAHALTPASTNPPASLIGMILLIGGHGTTANMIALGTLLTALESPPVGTAYAAIIRELRIVAGQAIREAWNSPAITSATDMKISSSVVDRRSLADTEQVYHRSRNASRQPHPRHLRG
jgi:hypothetical protein